MKEKKSKKSFIRRFAENKGVYIALFAALMMVGFYVYARQMKLSSERDIVSFDENAWQEAVKESGIEVIDIDGVEEEKTVKSERGTEESPKSKEQTEKKPIGTEDVAIEVMAAAPDVFEMESPCSGKILAECYLEELVFCSTMDDWRTHNGIDIAAAVGDPVKAVESGVVSKVYEDDFLGVVVEIEHENKMVSLYGNLQNADFIAVGTEVSKGDIIGGVGSPGSLEANMEPHLHFEVMADGELHDPKEYISFN
ncbi:MAG: M23 family metallopeptidase [Clostridia bacterium]|nr:M23 family metallopeptidase [Clostridia bacterium]